MSIRIHRLITGVSAFLFFVLPVNFSAVSGSAADSNQVPDVLVSFGPNQGAPYAVVIEKSSQSLFLFAHRNEVREVLRFQCSTGEVPGAKSRSGDSKTPEGVYFFTRAYPKRDLSPIYGSRAFPMDYPNIMDRLAERGGNSIWLHGTNKPLKPRDSNGCVVMENRDIDALAEYIVLNRTPIIIVDRLSYSSPESMIDAEKAIHTFLKDWNQALENGTYHRYLMFYDPEYLPEIAWWTEWNKLKKARKASDIDLSIGFVHVSIYRHDGIFVVFFDQYIKSPKSSEPIGTRKLFIRDGDDGLRIIGDAYQTPPEAEQNRPDDYPLVAAYRKLIVGPRLPQRSKR